jgi:hypothetical protein
MRPLHSLLQRAAIRRNIEKPFERRTDILMIILDTLELRHSAAIITGNRFE